MPRAAERRALRWERRPEERPQELLDAAMAVFAEKGYRNTRLDEIAEAAGVTKGTIYHYFSTKEELLLRAIEHHHERVFGRLDDELREVAGPPSARIRVFVRKGFASVDPARRRVLALLLQTVWQQHASGVRGLAISERRLLDEATEMFLAGLRTNPKR